jgi:hypothetical protein
MAKEKQTIKRLTFTEDEAEQALLAAAEARVETGDFPAFNELCKVALQTFLTPAAAPPQSSPAPAMAEPMTIPMAQIEQTLAAVQTTQQEMQQVLQQVVEQTAPSADSSAQEVTPRFTEPLAQLTQEVAELHIGQRNLHETVQQLRLQLAAVAQPTQAPNLMSEGLQTLQSEVRHLADSLTAALSQWQASPATVKGAQQPVATTAPEADHLTVSQATVNRLARFLEDF